MGNTPVEPESMLKVLLLVVGEVVSAAKSIWPCGTNFCEPDPISAAIRSCCPGCPGCAVVGSKIEGLDRIVVKVDSRRIRPSYAVKKKALSFLIGPPKVKPG